MNDLCATLLVIVKTEESCFPMEEAAYLLAIARRLELLQRIFPCVHQRVTHLWGLEQF